MATTEMGIPRAHAVLRGVPLTIVGAGRMGQALARAASTAGLRVHGPLGRVDLDEQLGASSLSSLSSSNPPSDSVLGGVVLLAVPDAALGEVAARVAPGPLVGHLSGATPLQTLAPHESFVMHPLMTVTHHTHSFRGATATVSASSAHAGDVARTLAELFGMRHLPIREEDRAAYHAAASIASNFLVAVEGFAEELADSVGLDRAALAPLVRASVDNWVEYGAQEALTGPVSRGDVATVARQRAAVAAVNSERLPLFDALVEATKQLAAGREQPGGHS